MEKTKLLGVVLAIGFTYVGSVTWGAEGDSSGALYRKYCASCHGEDGRGNGSVSRYLKIKPPDLTLLKKKNRGVYPLQRVMSSIDGSRTIRAHGDAQMPVWGEVFEKEAESEKYQTLKSLLRVKVIAEYLATLQR
ncbi:MAG: c-type cytochrome [Deltaproteobacteria bacterium]|nr:c-type cytochrome [Deltaproteobacteria bacterium]